MGARVKLYSKAKHSEKLLATLLTRREGQTRRDGQVLRLAFIFYQQNQNPSR